MIGLIEQLESLNSPLDHNLATYIFLASLSNSFSQFVMNYNMGKMEHTNSELLNMCVIAEKTFKREGGNGTIAKKKKWNPKLKPKGGVKKKQEEGKEAKRQCFHCRKEEHWKRNCQAYLASLKDNQAEGTA
ncbi:unnamed protein product [Prunus armeniaca]